MADEDAIEVDGEAEDGKKTRGGRGAMLKVGIFIAITLIFECTVAYFYFPSKAQIKLLMESRLADAAEKDFEEEAQNESDESTADGDLADTEEALMGDFSITTHQRESNTTIRISFKLTGIIKSKDADEFIDLYEASEQRFREQVGNILRDSKVSDLMDPVLALIKRKILAKSNQTIGKPMLKAVVIADFSYIES